MKVLIDSYDKVMQNPAGGVQMRIANLSQYLEKYCEIKKYDKWNDKISDYDVIHVFRLGVDRYDIIKYAKSVGLKVVLSPIIPDDFHSLEVLVNRCISKLPVMTGYKFLKQIMEMADYILPQNSIERENIIKVYGIDKSKIQVMQNGCSFDFKQKDNLFRDKFSIKEDYVLCVGRFDKNKNQLNLIKALKGLGIKVVLVGGEDLVDKEYFLQCKREADDNFIFTGWIDNKDPLLKSAYQNAKVVVLPSHKEIFGNSYVEGGCAGANTAVTSSLPTVRDYGLEPYTKTFNPSNTKSIRESVIEAFFADYSYESKKIFTDTFSWENVATEHYNIYSKLLGM